MACISASIHSLPSKSQNQVGTDSIYNNMSKNWGFYSDFYDYSRVQKLGSKHSLEPRVDEYSRKYLQYVTTVQIDLCKTVMYNCHTIRMAKRAPCKVRIHNKCSAIKLHRGITKLEEFRFSNTMITNRSQHYNTLITDYNCIAATCRILITSYIRYNILSSMQNKYNVVTAL